jgi:hypothetical protein
LNSALCFFLVFVTVTPWLNASLGAGFYLSYLSSFRGPPQTKNEFRDRIKKFGNSKHRYLHISSHGNEDEIGPENWGVSANELANMLKPYISKRRVFLSSCLGADGKFAPEILKTSQCYSVVAPIGKICFDDAAVFWISFYHLMFQLEKGHMKTRVLKQVAKKCASFIEMPFKVFYKSSGKIAQKKVGMKGEKWRKCQAD